MPNTDDPELLYFQLRDRLLNWELRERLDPAGPVDRQLWEQVGGFLRLHSQSPYAERLAEEAAELWKKVRRVQFSDHTPPDPFVLTQLQRAILETLNGQALKKEPLAKKVCGGDDSRLYKPGGIKELRQRGKVAHKPGVGYYRPDAPPQFSESRSR